MSHLFMNISPTAELFQAFLSRTFGFAVLASLLVSTQAQAIENWEYKLDLDYGMRVDQLNWNIAGNLAGSGPNVT
jgi:hypothetical protein